jgi:FkbM family methyltransferase
MSLNISDVNNTTETNLLDYFSNKNNVFLKMDIEGGELIWLRFIDKTILSKIKQMVIEFHDLDTKKK